MAETIITLICKNCGFKETMNNPYAEKDETRELVTCRKCHDKAVVDSTLKRLMSLRDEGKGEGQE